MSLPVVLGPEAEREFDEAADWYEQQAGLGVAFVARVRDVLNQIGQMPGLHAVVHGDIRRTRVRRFPYNVFYRLMSDRVEVVAIIHGRRDPTAWQSRT